MTKALNVFLLLLAYLILLVAWVIFDVPYLGWLVGVCYALRIAAAVIIYAIAGFPGAKFAKVNLPRNVYMGFVALDLLILALGWHTWLVVLEAVLAAPAVNFYYEDDK